MYLAIPVQIHDYIRRLSSFLARERKASRVNSGNILVHINDRLMSMSIHHNINPLWPLPPPSVWNFPWTHNSYGHV